MQPLFYRRIIWNISLNPGVYITVKILGGKYMRFKKAGIMVVIAALIVSTQGFALADRVSAPGKGTDKEVLFMDEKIVYDVKPQEMDGITMLPLRATLEKMGYEVTWNEKTKTVEIKKGPKWTSVVIGKNSYFKNKMAPSELSSAPVIVGGRTLLPLEFFTEILNINIAAAKGSITFSEEEQVVISGFVKDIAKDKM